MSNSLSSPALTPVPAANEAPQQRGAVAVENGHEHANLKARDGGHAVDIGGFPDSTKPSLRDCFDTSPPDVTGSPKASMTCASFTKGLPVPSVSLLQKIAAEIISTYILVFAGCGAAMVNEKSKGAVTHLGVAASFGIAVMVMIYSVGHISGAHMNPAVTLAFATVRHFPWKEVPIYWGAQIAASICASFSLRLIFENVADIGATLPAGTNSQSLVLEIILTFILMFVISGVATDTRAIGELAGIAVGSTVAMNALFAGPISGASMNPARSLGPAVAANQYRGIWIYITGPALGAVMGAWGYHLIRGSTPALHELEPVTVPASATKAKSFRR